MTFEQLIDALGRDQDFLQNVTAWKEIPPREAKYAEFPELLDSRLVCALEKHGIKKLYSHQAEAIHSILSGNNTAIVTPTASGKTLCYNIPVLNAILKNNESRALYLFPTKALSQDQISELHNIIKILGDEIEFDIKSYTFDGDTPQSARKAIRSAGHIVVTNPDMLHVGILPHHTNWIKLFENLTYVVIDEVHHYRGIFGSHLANVLRRLKRICKFYGSKPIFIACSATIGNPLELSQAIVGEKVKLIDSNGSPAGGKIFVLYNPPVVNKELGIRASYIKEAKKLAGQFIAHDIQTIIFARSRLRVEILLTYLKDSMRSLKKSPSQVSGYRGGYLPLQRREIEKGIREKQIIGVVSTNALELGIDIGQLQVAIMAGYPGTIASTWQQAGRAGRRLDTSMAILVASSAPLDQYIMNHPEYIYDKSPESGIVDPDNLIILLSHIKCAAFELPFYVGELYGENFAGEGGLSSTQEILDFLSENRIIHESGEKWHWMAETYPAESVSLRSAAEENVVIIDKTKPQEKVIGEIDLFGAQLMVHDDAIYIHESQQFHVDKLDWERRKAYIHEVKSDHYTDAQLKTNLKIIEVFEENEQGAIGTGFGDVVVTSLATMYKKIKFNTHENIGWGKIHLPEIELHTQAFWYAFPQNLEEILKLDKQGIGDGLHGAANVLSQVAPLFIMGDPRDLYSMSMVRAPLSQKPTIYIWERYPGGVGFSKKLCKIHRLVAESAQKLVSECRCETGCPSCVGPALDVGEKAKKTALLLLEMLSS